LNRRLTNFRKKLGEGFPFQDVMKNSRELQDKIDPDSVDEALFDIEEETYLISQIKDVLDELNIISCVQRQQDAVTKPFFRHICSETTKKELLGYNDGARTRAHFDEMVRAAENTYKDVCALGIDCFSFSRTV
jgi:hypothetical protein